MNITIDRNSPIPVLPLLGAGLARSSSTMTTIAATETRGENSDDFGLFSWAWHKNMEGVDKSQTDPPPNGGYSKLEGRQDTQKKSPEVYFVTSQEEILEIFFQANQGSPITAAA
jgi:hypothetical protein